MTFVVYSMVVQCVFNSSVVSTEPILWNNAFVHIEIQQGKNSAATYWSLNFLSSRTRI